MSHKIYKYRSGDKGVSIKLRGPMTENYGLDIDRNKPQVHLEGELLFGFSKILYQPIIAEISDSYFNITEIHISTLNFDLRQLFRQTLN
jgi:hypothetical protein